MSAGPYNLTNYYSTTSYANTIGSIALMRNVGSNEGIDIVNNTIITPTDVKINSISIDAVMNSFNGFKKVAYNNFYLLHLILKNANTIKSHNRYDTVLKQIVELDYFNGNDYFWVESLPLNESDNQIAMSYFKWQQYNQYSNMRMIDVYSVNPTFYKSTATNSQTGNLSMVRSIFKQLQSKATSQYLYEICLVLPFNGSLHLYIYTIFPNVLYQTDHTQWAMVANCLNLGTYFPIALTSINLGSLNTQYLNLVSNMNTTIGILQQSNWTDPTQYDNTWSFTSIANVANCNCLYSNPNSPYGNATWVGQSYLNCFVKNSNVDNQGRIYQMIVDLNQNYGPLTVGQIIVTTYTYGNQYYVSIVKICNSTVLTVTDPISQLQLQPNCFKEKILINSHVF